MSQQYLYVFFNIAFFFEARFIPWTWKDQNCMYRTVVIFNHKILL